MPMVNLLGEAWRSTPEYWLRPETIRYNAGTPSIRRRPQQRLPHCPPRSPPQLHDLKSRRVPHPRPLSHPLPPAGRGAPPPSCGQSVSQFPPLPEVGRGWERGLGGEAATVRLSKHPLSRQRHRDCTSRSTKHVSSAYRGRTVLAGGQTRSPDEIPASRSVARRFRSRSAGG